MTQVIENPIYEEKKSFLPLRIFGEGNKRYMVCPYELTEDNLKLQLLREHDNIAHFEVISVPGDFKRQFLYTKTRDKHIFTTSGYLFNGPVEVYSWKKRESPDRVKDYEREEIDMLEKVEMYHVRGDKENITGGLDDAIKKHLQRINGLDVQNISLEDALKAYNSIRHHVPKFGP